MALGEAQCSQRKDQDGRLEYLHDASLSNRSTSSSVTIDAQLLRAGGRAPGQNQSQTQFSGGRVGCRNFPALYIFPLIMFVR
jgi:hypothetical protein